MQARDCINAGMQFPAYLYFVVHEKHKGFYIYFL